MANTTRELDISTEKVCFVIVKAREFDAKVDPVIPDPGGNPIDNGEREVLSDYPDDPVYEELTTFFESLSEDELVNLYALVMLGREDYDLEDWGQALATARGDIDENTPRRLLEIPLIADYLQDGLTLHGHSCG